MLQPQPSLTLQSRVSYSVTLTTYTLLTFPSHMSYAEHGLQYVHISHLLRYGNEMLKESSTR